ncbi:hypothetical protein [Nitrosopumilus sp.]|uniref:hypothetical protein n=1 Tax=Nitrosopumilus sp. TaxID=2024843 RepID=UPI003D0AC9E2
MRKNVSNTMEYECECAKEKKYKVVFDGGDTGKYIVEYCQKCYDSDDMKFMVITEVIL